jgi:YVTN family beta-propeller protein
MSRKTRVVALLLLLVLALPMDACSPAPLTAPTPEQALPNMGQVITPLAPEGARFDTLNPDLADNPDWLAGGAVTSVVSPDKRTMLVLTSGYNRVYRSDGKPDAMGTQFNWMDSKEYVFVYDITAGAPVRTQVLTVPNTYSGIAFDPSGTGFYVSSGVGDGVFDAQGNVNPKQAGGDNIHVFALGADGRWAQTEELPLGHVAGNGLVVKPTGEQLPPNARVAVGPCAAGVAISGDGQTLVVANYYNDSITVFSGGLGHWGKGVELDLRPGKTDPSKSGVPGGEYPYWVSIKGTGPAATAYVSSIRDREIVVVGLAAGAAAAPAVTARIPVVGQPNKMTLNAAQTRLYVADDQADTVDVIDTASNTVIERIPVMADSAGLPPALAGYKGANPNSVVLSPDERQLYVTLGNLNAVAVVALAGGASGNVGRVEGLIPTGWYPTSASLSGDGAHMYVVNGKAPTGANPEFAYSYGPADYKSGLVSNKYLPQLTTAGLQSFPVPAPADLPTLTAQVIRNDGLERIVTASAESTMAAVRAAVKHVVFIIKENRTYDQVLGDLPVGNGDPSLAVFGKALTPNFHALATGFVTLDNIYATAEVSYDGWLWSTAAQAQDVIQKQFPVFYAGRGLSLDGGGAGNNRSVNVALPTLAERLEANPLTADDDDVLPGQTDVGAPDGPDNEVNTGYLWDAALRAGLTVRNYGFFLDGARYAMPADNAYGIPLERHPFATQTTMAIPGNVSLAPFTDPYFRGFDPSYPDYWRYQEWARDFDARYVDGGEDLPSLTLVRFMNDHTGNFATAIDGVNTPETQQADNDYAVGMLVEKIAQSKFASDTVIFVIEDDAQDGPDHVDAHRTTAYVAGAHVRQGALVSTQYNTIDFLRTIEEVLGLGPMNLNDAVATPMADVFTTTPAAWSFTAAPSAVLYGTKLPLGPAPAGLTVPSPAHDAAYWAQVTAGMDFTTEDAFDYAVYSRLTWTGIMGAVPYPEVRSGADLRGGREALLAGR